MNKLNTINGETLMSCPLQPLNFVVDTLISQGLHILNGSPKVGKSGRALGLAVPGANGDPVWGLLQTAVQPCTSVWRIPSSASRIGCSM